MRIGPRNQWLRARPVYIHFAGQLTRETITDLNRRLRSTGWNTQSDSGERTQASAGVNEVRYTDIKDKEAADQLAIQINSIQSALPKLQSKQITGGSSGVLEVWISN